VTALTNKARPIELQEICSHSANRCPRHNHGSLQPELSVPAIPRRMEQPNVSAGLGIERSNIRPLVAMTEVAIVMPRDVTGLDPVWHIR